MDVPILRPERAVAAWLRSVDPTELERRVINHEPDLSAPLASDFLEALIEMAEEDD